MLSWNCGVTRVCVYVFACLRVISVCRWKFASSCMETGISCVAFTVTSQFTKITWEIPSSVCIILPRWCRVKCQMTLKMSTSLTVCMQVHLCLSASSIKRSGYDEVIMIRLWKWAVRRVVAITHRTRVCVCVCVLVLDDVVCVCVCVFSHKD